MVIMAPHSQVSRRLAEGSVCCRLICLHADLGLQCRPPWSLFKRCSCAIVPNVPQHAWYGVGSRQLVELRLLPLGDKLARCLAVALCQLLPADEAVGRGKGRRRFDRIRVQCTALVRTALQWPSASSFLQRMRRVEEGRRLVRPRRPEVALLPVTNQLSVQPFAAQAVREGMGESLSPCLLPGCCRQIHRLCPLSYHYLHATALSRTQQGAAMGTCNI